MASQHELYATNGYPETPEVEAKAFRVFPQKSLFRCHNARLRPIEASTAVKPARRILIAFAAES